MEIVTQVLADGPWHGGYGPPFPFWIFPLVWLLVLCNHSYIHSHFTFRILAPCVFALLLALTPAENPAGGTTKSAA